MSGHGEVSRLEDKVDPSSGFSQLRVIFILSFDSVLTTKVFRLSDRSYKMEEGDGLLT